MVHRPLEPIHRVDIPDNGTEFDWARDASFSFEAWFKTTSSGVAAVSRNRVDLGHVTSWWIGTSPQGTGIIELRDNAGTNTVLKGTTVIANGQWHHVIGVEMALPTRTGFMWMVFWKEP